MRIEEFLKMAESEMGALQTLRLTYADLYQLDAASFQAFCKALAQCPNLQQLDLERNNLGKLDAARFQAFCNAIAQCPNLQQLDLGGNVLGQLDAASFQALGEALAQCPNLQQLDLWGNNLGKLDAASFQAFCNALAQCPNLQQLDLSINDLGQLDAARFQALCNAIAQCPNLQQLDLKLNHLGKLDAASFQAFCNALAQCPNLQQLDLWGNNLGKLDAASFQAFCNALAQCPNLQQLDLGDNVLGQLDAASFQALGEAVINSPNFRIIAELTKAYMPNAFSEGLIKLIELKTNLQDCLIDNDKIAALLSKLITSISSESAAKNLDFHISKLFSELDNPEVDKLALSYYAKFSPEHPLYNEAVFKIMNITLKQSTAAPGEEETPAQKDARLFETIQIGFGFNSRVSDLELIFLNRLIHEYLGYDMEFETAQYVKKTDFSDLKTEADINAQKENLAEKLAIALSLAPKTTAPRILPTYSAQVLQDTTSVVTTRSIASASDTVSDAVSAQTCSSAAVSMDIPLSAADKNKQP